MLTLPLRTSKRGADDPPRFEAGQANSHQLLDSKDQRSLGNTLEAATKVCSLTPRPEQILIHSGLAATLYLTGREGRRGARGRASRPSAACDGQRERALARREDRRRVAGGGRGISPAEGQDLNAFREGVVPVHTDWIEHNTS